MAMPYRNPVPDVERGPRDPVRLRECRPSVRLPGYVAIELACRLAGPSSRAGDRGDGARATASASGARLAAGPRRAAARALAARRPRRSPSAQDLSRPARPARRARVLGDVHGHVRRAPARARAHAADRALQAQSRRLVAVVPRRLRRRLARRLEADADQHADHPAQGDRRLPAQPPARPQRRAARGAARRLARRAPRAPAPREPRVPAAHPGRDDLRPRAARPCGTASYWIPVIKDSGFDTPEGQRLATDLAHVGGEPIPRRPAVDGRRSSPTWSCSTS